MANDLDEILINGLIKLKDLEFSDVPAEDEIEHIFSDEYIKAKNKLLKKLGYSYWKYVNTVAKKIAVIIIALIISFSSLMTVDAVREKMVEFVYKIYNTFTIISTNNKSPDKNIARYYIVQNIPTKYKLDYISKYQSRQLQIYWVDKYENYIMFTQTNLSDNTQFNSEHGVLSEYVINEIPCLICKDQNLYYCYWEFDGYRFELVYPLDLGEEFMSEVVGNLVEIDPDELAN